MLLLLVSFAYVVFTLFVVSLVFALICGCAFGLWLCLDCGVLFCGCFGVVFCLVVACVVISVVCML